MKNIIPLFLTLLLYSNHTFSQLSVSIDNKYGFKMLGTYGVFGYGNSSSNNGATTYESKKFCFGNGYQAGINVRYLFKGNIGAELGFGYLIGSKDKTTYYSNSGGIYPSTFQDETYFKARMMRVNIGACYIGAKKISPIIRMGMIMGFGKIIGISKSTDTQSGLYYNPNPPYNSTYTTTTNNSEMEYEYYGGLSLGFYSALGINYRATNALSMSLCFDVLVQEFAPKKGKLTKSTENGIDQLPLMTKSEKEVEFVNEYTYINSQPNNVSASKSSRMSFPLSSFGPSFSISYTIGKNEKPANTASNTTN